MLKDRLIFVDWNDGNSNDEIYTYSKPFQNEKSIDMVRIKLNDYSILYEAIFQNKARYIVPVLRRLKSDIYNLVLTNKPTGK